MKQYGAIFKDIGLRLVIAGPLMIIGGIALRGAGGGIGGALGGGLLGCACIIGGAVILAPGIAKLAAEPLGSLFYPSEHFDRPAPLYSVAEAREIKGEYREAMLLYEKIAAEYPGEVKPYISMINIAIIRLKDSERAAMIHRRGLAALNDPKNRESLTRSYEAVCTRLDPRPAWYKEQAGQKISVKRNSAVEPGHDAGRDAGGAW